MYGDECRCVWYTGIGNAMCVCGVLHGGIIKKSFFFLRENFEKKILNVSCMCLGWDTYVIVCTPGGCVDACREARAIDATLGRGVP
jgi:hypothetical protein